MTSQPCPAAENPRVKHTRATDYNNHRCRCEAARLAYRSQVKKRHLPAPTRRVDATGTRRRLQALKAIGWSTAAMAPRIGLEPTHIEKVIYCHQAQVTVRFEQLVRTAYDALWDTPGGNAFTARRAAARGWLAPLWWDDDLIDDPAYQPARSGERWGRYDVDHVAVDLVLAGRALSRPLNRGERLQVVETLTRRGHSAREIAEHVGITERTIVRDLADLRLQVAS